MEAFSGLTTEFGKALGEDENGACALRAQLLNARAKSIREGDFKILVCGRFRTGKSTFVNALLESDAMVTTATVCTAAIAVVRKGKDTQKVKVEFTDGTSKEMSLDQFKKEYQMNAMEPANINEAYAYEKDLDRFARVDHVEMQSMHPMIASGCSLIDTPGLSNFSKTTYEFLPKADAVVFMMDALSLLSKADLEFIHRNFADKHKRNVFFVINRINQLNPGQLESAVKPSVKVHLENCFTDENGVFDEELYAQRVFFVNAYDAFHAKAGLKGKFFGAGRWMEYDPDYENTGMPEFTDAMNRLVNSDERLTVLFSSALDQMFDNYKACVADMNAKMCAISNDCDAEKTTQMLNIVIQMHEIIDKTTRMVCGRNPYAKRFHL